MHNPNRIQRHLPGTITYGKPGVRHLAGTISAGVPGARQFTLPAAGLEGLTGSAPTLTAWPNRN